MKSQIGGAGVFGVGRALGKPMGVGIGKVGQIGRGAGVFGQAQKTTGVSGVGITLGTPMF